MKLFALIAVLFASQAFAVNYTTKSFEYTDMGNDDFQRTYYSCDFAESTLRMHLKNLGALNIKTRCMGGIDSLGMYPVSLSAEFSTPASNKENFSTVEAKTLSSATSAGNACYFNTKLLQALWAYFPNVVVTRMQDRCSSSDSRWSYDVQIYR